MYRPDFSGRELIQVFGQDKVPDTLREARMRIASRFFVDPQSIPSLWLRIQREHPEWYRRQIERNEADANEGLPVYSTTGPVLGPDLPWEKLPPGPGNDMLYAKHLHRFAFAPRSALACLYDKDAVNRLNGSIAAWMRCASSGGSPLCHDSNLGVIQRILALSWAWAFLAARADSATDAKQAELEWRVLNILYTDIRFLIPRLGGSKPNNHLLADRFAAWYLDLVFPEFMPDSDPKCERSWCRELLRQTYEDGGSFEHSMHYHEFACEMGAAYLLLCRRMGKQPDPEAETRIESLLKFQAAITGPEAVPLPVGNGVEDTLFPLDSGAGWCPGSLRELYRALFNPAIPPAPADDISRVRAFWLLGGQLAPVPDEQEPEVRLHAFPDSGMYVLNDDELKGRMIFRTGPAIDAHVCTGHMHADFLSVFFSIRGIPLIVDSGTYTYRSSSKSWPEGSPDWRGYFSGPRAHNGIAIDGHDPLGVFRSDFRKSDIPVRIETRHSGNARMSMVEARYCGGGFYDQVSRNCLHVHGRFWLVIDRIPADAGGIEQIDYGFQMAPGCEISRVDRDTSLVSSAGVTMFTLTASRSLGEPEIVEGRQRSPGGWVSRVYGDLVPAPQLRYSLASRGVTSAFLINSYRPGDIFGSVEIEETDADTALIKVVVDGDNRHIVRFSERAGIQGFDES